jgi:hypothetical protein
MWCRAVQSLTAPVVDHDGIRSSSLYDRLLRVHYDDNSRLKTMMPFEGPSIHEVLGVIDANLIRDEYPNNIFE